MSDLLKITPEELARVDIAEMNLLCAEGLPGAESIDVKACLSTLDRWTQKVRAETESNLPLYRRDPAKFHGMEGFYRMQMMITVLMQDLQVGYDVALDSSPENPMPAQKFFAEAKPLFLQGLLTDQHLGTCASMPVLYVAIGRRLGYPVKLVAAKSHCFVRWEGLDGRFNIEGTNRGMTSHPDDYYQTFPRPMFEADLQSGDYLKSLSPPEELASFLVTRGVCLQVNHHFVEAMAAYQKAHTLVPASPLYRRFAEQKLPTTP